MNKIFFITFVACSVVFSFSAHAQSGKQHRKFDREAFLAKKNDFITISYGILVNMRYVQYINLKEMMVVLENEIQLPLSYKYKNSVKEAYQEYKIR